MSEVALRTAVDLVRLHCGNCGIEFAVPDFWLQGRQNGCEGENEFYCPNGHVRVFRENALTRAKKQLETALRQKEYTERLLATSERSLKRLKKRVVNGVCPACQRSFENLRRHIKTKHPTLALPPP